MTRPRQEGFTLVELLVVAVMGAVVLMATYQVLITNQRAYTTEEAQIRAQQNLRAGSDILFAELREISPAAGDLIMMEDDSLTVRLGRTFGTTCTVTLGGTPVLVVRQGGVWFEDNDSVFVFADVDTMRVDDDVWHKTTVNAGDTTSTCGGRKAQSLSFPGMGTAFQTDTVWPGAVVRAFEWYTYGLYQVGDRWYLGRHVTGGDVVPLVGPLAPPAENGLEFTYFDTYGNATTTAADVRQIGIFLRSPAEVRGIDGDMVVDSLTTRIHTRN